MLNWHVKNISWEEDKLSRIFVFFPFVYISFVVTGWDNPIIPIKHITYC